MIARFVDWKLGRWNMKPGVVQFLILFFSLMYLAYAGGRYEIKFIEYDNYEGLDERGELCEGHRSELPCNFFFKITLRLGDHVNSFTTDHTSANIVKFNCSLGKNLHNPVVQNVSSLKEPLNLTFASWDFDRDRKHDHMETYRMLLPLKPDGEWREKLYKGKPYLGKIFHGRKSSQLHLEYRALCDRHFYGSDCTRFCFPNDDHLGHYACESDGRKVCRKGWKDPEKNCVTSDRSLETVLSFLVLILMAVFVILGLNVYSTWTRHRDGECTKHSTVICKHHGQGCDEDKQPLLSDEEAEEKV